MGATKYELFENDICELSTLLKSISHPARLKAILLIADSVDGELSTDKIIDEVGLSQSTISYHLKQLKDAGVVDTKIITLRSKTFQFYRLNHNAISKLVTFLELVLKKVEIKSNFKYETLSTFYTKFKDFNFKTQMLQL